MIRLLVDLVVAAHFAFIVFAVLGGLLVLLRPWVAWLHLPAATWAAMVVLMGWICPLTPLENRLRGMGGMATYDEAFLDRYLTPVIYPEGLTREHQVLLGIAVLALNLAVYIWVVRRRRAGRTSPKSG